MTDRNALITQNYDRIIFNINEAKVKYSNANARLMAVTKTVPYEQVNHAVSLGIDLLGENRVQEYLTKCDFYTKTAEIHFIGGLQNNKVKYIINKVSMIHSLDSIKLAEEIGKRAVANNLVMDTLVEVNIGGEASKAGVAPEMVADFLMQLSEIRGINVRGLMAIPPIGSGETCLDKMYSLFCQSKSLSTANFDTLSMGMSSDYTLAIKHGATIVRVGTALFGRR